MSEFDMGALAGLRVVDVCGDSGRFATKLLAELGADVVQICAPPAGLTLTDPEAAALGGVADWWYDGGKRRCRLDLASAQGSDSYRRLAASADLIVETERPGRLAELGLDHADLTAANPALVQVSVTHFGRTGPRAHWHGSDLVAAAMGGMMSLTGLEDRPLNVWGRQAYNYAGFVAATSGLAAVLAARATGRGAHVDLSIHEVVTGSIENLFMQYIFDDVLPLPKVAPRQGALHWLGAYDLAECRGPAGSGESGNPGEVGYVMITPTPTPDLLFEWMIETGCDEAARWLGQDPADVLADVPAVMAAIRRWIAPRDSRDVWWEAQERHVAFGGVLDIAEVCANPQFAHRGFLADVGAVAMPARLASWSSGEQAGAVAPRPPDTACSGLDEILSAWSSGPGSTDSGAASAVELPDARPLDGVRIADFTWVLAGPSATRLLGDLGADVIRVQNEERSTLVNSPDFPYYYVWNRSKRSATLDMKHPDGLEAARRLIETCDVLIENYSAGVLDSWGLDWETVHRWNPRLVYVTMSGCGHDGPWRHVISYAPTVHAVCGITHLTNFSDRGDVGPGFSLNDHLAGFAAAVSTVAALVARERTGEGQRIDLAQLEVGTYSIGPALIRQSAGVPPAPEGNRDGIADHVPNEVYATADGGWLAVSVVEAAQWLGLCGLLGDARLDDPTLATAQGRRDRRSLIDTVLREWIGARSATAAAEELQAAGVPAGPVQDAHDLFTADPQHAARGYWLGADHAVFGERATDAFAALWNTQRWTPRRLSPAYLGEHNFEVWAEAGLADDEIAEGIGSGLFG